ncbi:MAG: hypothetical protein ABI190_04025 [Casimicrobiaceae bacterium]
MVAVVIAAGLLALCGERWLLRDAPVQSIEFMAASCAADALSGSPVPLRSACNEHGIDPGKSL